MFQNLCYDIFKFSLVCTVRVKILYRSLFTTKRLFGIERNEIFLECLEAVSEIVGGVVVDPGSAASATISNSGELPRIAQLAVNVTIFS